jgi:hypothetical protein
LPLVWLTDFSTAIAKPTRGGDHGDAEGERASRAARASRRHARRRRKNARFAAGPGGTRIGRDERRVACDGFFVVGDYQQKEGGADRVRFTIENTRDGGKSWQTFLEASDRKQA